MPAKVSTVCYIHNSTERLTQDFTLKEITAVTKLDDDDPTKVLYLKVKAFIPSDTRIKTHIKNFNTRDVVFLKGKFIAYAEWYSINATSIKVMENLDFDTMPSVGLNVMVQVITTKTVRNLHGKSMLEFYVKENLGDREPHEFWVEVTHDPNLRYLVNKTNSINQTMRSTTVILIGVISYVPPVIDESTQEERVTEKHILDLEDISLISTNRNTNNGHQTLNIPWLNSQLNGGSNRMGRSPQGTISRSSRRGRDTLTQMNPTTRNQSLASILETNPIPSNMMTTETRNSENSQQED